MASLWLKLCKMTATNCKTFTTMLDRKLHKMQVLQGKLAHTDADRVVFSNKIQTVFHCRLLHNKVDSKEEIFKMAHNEGYSQKLH